MKNQRRKFANLAIGLIGIAGVLTGNMDSASAASSDCASGYACVWSSTGYSGTLKRFTATGTYLSIGLSTTNSYYNHRTKRVYLHEAADGSARYVCVNPGAKVSTASGWQARAKAIYLSTTTNC